MKILSITVTTLISAFTLNVYAQNFSGKILYENSFTDLKKNDISDQLVIFFGKQNHYFINDSNYKAYDENNRLLYLYNSSSNTYYSVDRQNNVAKKINAGQITSNKIKFKNLSDNETICGYECSSVELKTDKGTYIFYFTSLIQVDKNNYSKHYFGEWNSCLNATNGAVPLKVVFTDKKTGYIWTSIAKEVSKLNLTTSDFILPEDIGLKE